MKRIIIITGNELRHDFFRKYIAASSKISVLQTYCEVPDLDLIESIHQESENKLRSKHLLAREQVEKDFFELYSTVLTDKSNAKYIPKGDINSVTLVNEITEINPDLIISYGSSIITSSLLNTFKGKFINIHLGLSPYYRGTATNLFPFINEEISCVGVTFMHIDKGIDTGKIIHQMRPTIYHWDSVHQIGNRLICEMAKECKKIIILFDTLQVMNALDFDVKKEKIYRKRDFTEQTVAELYAKFKDGIIDRYLENKLQLDSEYPIIQNPKLL